MLQTEINHNHDSFEIDWISDQKECIESLKIKSELFRKNYTNICTIQAWREFVINKKLSIDSQAFFFESQNDLLTSHCLARSGAFRQSLKSLRSSIENIYFSLFYNEHPIELLKWKDGLHKISFQELHTYFSGHPYLKNTTEQECGLANLKDEYSTLSKAVHGSALAFRMTKNLTDIRIWSNDISEVGKWSSRENSVISSFNLLLINLFKDELLGTKNRQLRQVIGLTLTDKKISNIKEKLNINIIKNN